MTWLACKGAAVAQLRRAASLTCVTWRVCAASAMVCCCRCCGSSTNVSSMASSRSNNNTGRRPSRATAAAQLDAYKRTMATAAATTAVADRATHNDHNDDDDDSEAMALSSALVRVLQLCGDGLPRAQLEARALQLHRTHNNSNNNTSTTAQAAALSRAWRCLAMQHYYGRRAHATTHTAQSSVSNKHNDTDDADAASDVVVYACDWHATLRAVAASLPYEGANEDVVVSLLRRHCPYLLPRVCASLCDGSSSKRNRKSTTATTTPSSLAAWLCAHGSAHVLVTRSAVTRQPLYYAAHCNNVYPSYMQQQEHGNTSNNSSDNDDDVRLQRVLCIALAALQRPKQLPVWTDIEQLRPLLLPNVRRNNNNDNNNNNDDDEALVDALARLRARGCVDVRAEVHVRAATRACAVLVLVDATSLPDDDDDTWRRLLRARVQRDTRASTAATAWRGRCDVHVLRARSRSAASVAAVAGDAKTMTRTAATAANDNNNSSSEALGLPADMYCVVHDVAVEVVCDAEHVAAALVSTLTHDASTTTTTTTRTAAAAPWSPCDRRGVVERSDETVSDDDTATTHDARRDGGSSSVDAAPRVLVLCGDAKARAFAAALRALPRRDLRYDICTPATMAAVAAE